MTRPAVDSALALAIALALPATAPALSLRQPAGKDACLQQEATNACPAARGIFGASGAAVSPDGKNVYVASAPDSFGALSSFSRDPATGVLTQLPGKQGCISSSGRSGHNLTDPKVCAKGKGLSFLNDVAISGDGRTLYALSAFSGVDTFRRDPATGAVTPLQCFTTSPSRNGCRQAALQSPVKLVLAPDDKTLIVGGESLSTFSIGSGGRIVGKGTCVTVLRRKPEGLCKPAPRNAHLFPIAKLALAANGKRLYATSANGDQLQAYRVSADKITPGACAGRSGDASRCRAARQAENLADVAVAPDGNGVYTASARFVTTDEEDGSGYFAGSDLGAFRAPALSQLKGRRGCVLFAAQRGSAKTCAKAPSERGKGFFGAAAIAVTPNGRHVLGGFDSPGAVALLSRDRRTQALAPVAATGGCLSERKGRLAVASCGEGLGIGQVTDIAMSPDGRNAYVLNSDGLAVVQLR